jgi:hypothetical protein
MQQSRLDRFFMITTNKRLSTTENDDDNNNKKFKRTDSSSQNNDNFSLNEFYLEKFLLILSSLLKYHKDLFDENELILFENFQKLSG